MTSSLEWIGRALCNLENIMDDLTMDDLTANNLTINDLTVFVL